MDSFSIAVHGSPYGGMKLMLSLTLAEVHENTKQNSADFLPLCNFEVLKLYVIGRYRDLSQNVGVFITVISLLKY